MSRIIESKASDFSRTGAEETTDCITNMAGILSIEELILCRKISEKNTFAERITTSEFWQSVFCRKDQISYSPAIDFYLGERFERMNGFSFEDYFSKWAHIFFATRMHPSHTQDILVLFLHENLRMLKHLYLLELPHNLDSYPGDAALQACFDSLDRRNFVSTPQFSRWVLDDWLPFHLRFYHRKYEYGLRDRSIDVARAGQSGIYLYRGGQPHALH